MEKFRIRDKHPRSATDNTAIKKERMKATGIAKRCTKREICLRRMKTSDVDLNPELPGTVEVIVSARVVDPYSFFTDPDPDPELDVGGQYGSGSKFFFF